MRKSLRINEFRSMYDNLTDPEKIEEARQRTARARRLQEKQADTGL